MVVAVIGGFMLWPKHEPREIPTIRLGLQVAPATGLIKVAVDKNFFQEEGVHVVVKEFTGGKFALQALIGNSLDLVSPAEFPVTLAILNGEKLSILTEVNETVGGFPMIVKKKGMFLTPKPISPKRGKLLLPSAADQNFLP